MFRTFLLSRRDVISVEKGHAPPQKSRRDVISAEILNAVYQQIIMKYET